MKLSVAFFASILFAVLSIAQVPNYMSYQSVIRDNENQLLANQEVGMQLSIVQGTVDGPAVYVETHTLTTNSNGLVALEIGSGQSTDNFSAIDWSDGPYFAKTETDPDGGTNYTITGTSQMLSVPYALYAETAESYEETQDLSDVASLGNAIHSQIKELMDPTDDQDAVTKNYVDKIVDALLKRIEVLEDSLGIEPDDDPPGEPVEDIEGNVYETVIIGNQEWFDSNLKTRRYKNGDFIDTGLNNDEWINATEGAYAIFPHQAIPGLASDAEVMEAYGVLYNWYAASDPRGLCPEGWQVPEVDDFRQLRNYIIDNYDIEEDKEGNALKSCRQIDSPLGGECDTNEHPRWREHDVQYGTDDFGFGGLPAGTRMGSSGTYASIGLFTTWWASTVSEEDETRAHLAILWRSLSRFGITNEHKTVGRSMRCVRSLD